MNLLFIKTAVNHFYGIDITKKIRRPRYVKGRRAFIWLAKKYRKAHDNALAEILSMDRTTIYYNYQEAKEMITPILDGKYYPDEDFLMELVELEEILKSRGDIEARIGFTRKKAEMMRYERSMGSIN